jgi:hypothetical protein
MIRYLERLSYPTPPFSDVALAYAQSYNGQDYSRAFELGDTLL